MIAIIRRFLTCAVPTLRLENVSTVGEVSGQQPPTQAALPMTQQSVAQLRPTQQVQPVSPHIEESVTATGQLC